jgi:hypothetical protein
MQSEVLSRRRPAQNVLDACRGTERPAETNENPETAPGKIFLGKRTVDLKM